MKRIFAILILTTIIISSLCIQAAAFGGYAHWDIATRAVSMHNIPSAQNYATAYKTGCLLADIGKAHWDDSYTDSDSAVFSRKMMNIEAPNGQGVYFARGWQSHVYQDTNGSVSSIINDNGSYRSNCGQIDEYLRDTIDISCPINGTANMYVVYEMIRNTYDELDGFAPTNAEIDAEIEDMFYLYHTQIALNIQGMSSAQISNMNNQFNTLAAGCYSTSAIYSIGEDALTSKDDVTMNFILEERSNPLKHNTAIALENQASDYAHIETVSVDADGGAEIRFVIDDPEAYNELVEQHAQLLVRDTIYESL